MKTYKDNRIQLQNDGRDRGRGRLRLAISFLKD